MTKSNITEYDKVAANNTDVQDVPLGENQMYPADVNNAFREVMADLADVNDGTVALTSPKATAFEVTNNITVGGTVDGRDVATDGTKLDGIEAGATADQTAAEIKTAYESNANTNEFSDAEQSKLAGIETNATADQTASEIKTAYESNANTNAFTDTEKSKLTGIEAGATADQTAAEIRTLVDSATDSNVFTDADHSKLDGIAAGAEVNTVDSVNTQTGTVVLDAADVGALALTGGTLTGVLNLNASTGYGNLEIGGPSGAFIDFKTPFSDDYDARLIYNGSYFIVGTGLDQPVLLQHNNSTKLNTNSTGVSVTGNLDASDGIFVGGTNSYIYEGAANQLNFRIGADGPYGEMIDAGGGVMEFGNAGGELALTAAGTERARLTSTGLGIETTSPFSPLHLGTGESSPSASGNMADNGLTISNGSGGRAIQIGVDDTAQGAYIQSGYVNNSNVANSLSFYNGANESMTITSDGNVVFQVGINAQTGTTYTTVLADQSKLVTLTNASAITVTIPANSSVAYPVGTKIDFAQLGAGQVTFAGAGGVTVNSTPTLKLRDQYSGASCIKTATDTWLLVGDLASS